MRTLLPVFLLVTVVAIAAACGSNTSKEEAGADTASPVTGQRVEADGGAFTDVTPAQLQTMLEDKDFVFVNTHIPYGGEIEGTDLFIPFNEVEQRMSELPAAPDAKIVVYCRSGGMSGIAAKTLVGLGYTNIWNLDGGMIAWEEAGYPLLQAQQ